MKRLLKSVTTSLLCLLMFLGCFSAKTIKAEETRYNLKEFQWAEDFSSAIAVFYLIEDPTQEEYVQAEVSEYDRTEPTCELYGSIWHLAQATFEGKTYSDNQEELLLPLDHDYHFSHFVWNEDNTSAQASLVCSRDESHTSLVDAQMSEDVTPATCTEAGKVVYTASYEEETESKEVTLEALGHKYGQPEWQWAEDFSTAQAVFTCEHDSTHQEKVDAEITEDTSVSGKISYTASVTFEGNEYTDTKTVDAPVPVSYELLEWRWSEDYDSAIAVFVNTENEEDKVYINATVTSSGTEASCEEDGVKTYVATAVFEGETYSDTQEVTTPATGHEYEAKEWYWGKNNETCSVSLVCKKCEHTVSRDAKVTKTETEATCEEAGEAIYRAAVTYENQHFYTNKTVTLPALGHRWANINYEWIQTAEGYDVTATAECERDKDHTLTETTTATWEYVDSTETQKRWKAVFENDAFTTQIRELTASGTCGDNITWELIGDELILTGTGKMYDYDSYNNYVPWYSYDYRNSIKKVTISDGITSIGNYAFRECRKLKAVEISSSVTEIGYNAFSYCENLVNVFLPENLQKLSAGIFNYCSSLESIVIPDTVTTIESDAFYRCKALKEINLPDSVVSIGDSAFSYSGLTSVTIPDSVATLKDSAFSYCENLETVHLPNSITYLANRLFSECKKLNHVVIPENITSIGYSAFSGCTSLSDITLHDGITSLGWEGTFSNCTSLKSLRVPKKVNAIRDNTFKGCTALESIYLPESVESIGNNAFEGCIALKQIASEGTIRISEKAFSGCTALELVDIYRIAYLDNYAFENCKNLKEVKYIMPENIGDYAFLNCSSLTDITIFNLTKSVGTGAFRNCTALNNVIFDGTSTEWDAITVGNYNEPLMNASVTYHKPVTAVKAETGEVIIYVYLNEPVQINATVEPSDAYDKELRYNCSGEGIEYTLTKDGVFTLLSRKKNSQGYYGYIGISVVAHNQKYVNYSVSVCYKPEITSISCTSGKIKLEWSGNDDMDHYEVYRKEGNGNYSLIASPTTTDYTDSNIINGRTYTYKVRAYSKWYIDYMEDGHWSRYSEEKSIVAQADTPENPFTDVQESIGKTTYKAILWAYENGIVKGTSATTYSPEADCTRAQLCVMLWRLKGKPAVTVTDNPFSDVGTSLGNTTYKSILWAYDQGIVKGSEPGKFNPGGSTTRAQMAVMLWRLAGKPAPGITESPFVDVVPSIGNTTYKAILWAYKNGITKGTDSTHFSPNSECTRAQLAVFLYRLNNLYGYIK